MGKYANNTKKQKGKKGLIITLAVIFILVAAAVGTAVWVLMNYHIVSGKLYAKDLEVLDLRSQEVDPSYVEKLSEKLPDCDIRWNIAFQGGHLEDDVTEVTVTALSEKDLEQLDYARQLKTVKADGCADYEMLELLRQRRPEVEVSYSVAFSSGSCPWGQEALRWSSVTEEDVSLLKHLPNLKKVVLTEGTYDPKCLEALRSYLQDSGLEFGMQFRGNTYTGMEEELEIDAITDGELEMLAYFSNLKNLTLKNPAAEPERIFALQDQLPGVAVAWEVSLGAQTYDAKTTEVDLTAVEVTNLAEVEQKMAYLPDLKSVTFGVCGVDNENWGNSKSKLTASPIKNDDMAAYRDRVRKNYKVVWTVRLGPHIALRTDADNFMPNHFGVGQLPDSYAYNLRYCEEMVCLDVGHMTLTDISFVEFMPNLKYLILAWTEVQYIEPIRTCKNLVFLELDWSCIRDISPLVDCTALEDLNLGKTYCDITPLKEMTWLKNVYMIRRHSAGVVGQALPDTRVVASDDPDAATVGYGWRRLPNYYAMRDCLNAPYMN